MPPKIQSHFPLPSPTSPVHEPLFSEHACSSTAQLTAWSAPPPGCGSQCTEWQGGGRGGRGRRDISQILFALLPGSSSSPTWGPLTSLFPVNALKSSPSVFTLPEALRGEAAGGTRTQPLRKPTQRLVRGNLHLPL